MKLDERSESRKSKNRDGYTREKVQLILASSRRGSAFRFFFSSILELIKIFPAPIPRAAHNVICPIAIHKGITTPIKALGRFLRGTLDDRSNSLRSANCVRRVNLALNVCRPPLKHWMVRTYVCVNYVLFARDRRNRYLWKVWWNLNYLWERSHVSITIVFFVRQPRCN